MLTVSDFIDAANLPIKWQERDLQIYLMNCLEQKGFQVRDEVKSNGGRADIVSDFQGGSIIEVKKYLDRETIYQAVGQLHLYGFGNKRKLVIMGFLTTDTSKEASALTTASMIEQDPRYSVIFVNVENEWYPGAESHSPVSWKFRLPQWVTNFDWLKKPAFSQRGRDDNAMRSRLRLWKRTFFSILRWLYRITTTHPLPVFLIVVLVYALATSSPEPKENLLPTQNQLKSTPGS